MSHVTCLMAGDTYDLSESSKLEKKKLLKLKS